MLARVFATPQPAGAPQCDADFENHFVDVLSRELHNPCATLRQNCDVSLRLGFLHPLWAGSKSRHNAVVDFRTSAISA